MGSSNSKVIALTLILGACTSHPTNLRPHLEEPIKLEEIQLVIHTYDNVLSSTWACLKESGAAPLYILTPPPACSRAWDHKCIVHVPAGFPDLLEHELLHCQGYTHKH